MLVIGTLTNQLLVTFRNIYYADMNTIITGCRSSRYLYWHGIYTLPLKTAELYTVKYSFYINNDKKNHYFLVFKKHIQNSVCHTCVF